MRGKLHAWERHMMALTFRKAAEADMPQLAELNQQLQIDERHRNRMELVELVPRMTRWCASEGYEAVLFELDGETVGYALYRREPEFYYLKQFFVCRERRRRGIGRRAVEWLAANVWNELPAVCLDVLVQNEPGIAFWRAVGFGDYCITMERRHSIALESAAAKSQPTGG
jgi:predicted acetyltransferase